MKRVVKILSLSVFIIVMIPIVTLFILSKMHHQSVHDELVASINEEFDGKLTFDNFTFSYLRDFPSARIGIQGIAILENGNEIATIEQVSINLNIWALWHKKIQLRYLGIEDANLSYVIDEFGHKPKILSGKREKSETDFKTLLIDADKIEIKNVNVYFENQIKKNAGSFRIHKASLNLVTEDTHLIFRGELNGHIDSVVSNQRLMLSNQPMSLLDIVFVSDEKTGIKELKNGYVLAHSVKLIPRLSMEPHEDGQNVTLQISADEDFNGVLELLEFRTGIDVKQINENARFNFTYNQIGFVNPFTKAHSELNFEITDAQFAGDDLPYAVDIIKISGRYNNGENQAPGVAELHIDTVTAKVHDSFINGRFKLTDLGDPFIVAEIQSKLSLDHLFHQDSTMHCTGVIEVDLTVDGKLSELKSLHFDGQQKAKGSVKIDNLELELHKKGFFFDLDSGTILLSNHILEVTNLDGSINQSPFHFQGVAENLDRFFLLDSEDLSGKFNFEFEELNLADFKIGNESQEKDLGKGLPLLFSSSIEIQVNGKKLITDAGDIEDFRMKAKFENESLKIPLLEFNFIGGYVDGVADISFGTNNIDKIKTNLNLDFKELMLDTLSSLSKRLDNKDTARVFPAIPFDLDARLNFSANVITYHDATLIGTSTTIYVTNSHLKIIDFSAGLPFGDVKMNIEIPDYANQKRVYKGQIGLKIDSLVVDRFLQMRAFGLPDIDSQQKESKKNEFSLPRNVDVRCSIQADYLAYENATIDHVNFDIHYKPDKIDLKNLQFNFADGHVHVHGFTNSDIGQNQSGYVYSKADSIDLGMLLKAFDNFDQDIFTSENTYGKVSWSSDYYFGLNKQLTLNIDKNLLRLNANIHDAVLDQIKPIEKSLFFVGHKSKDHVVIEDIRTNIFLRKNKLFVTDLLMNDNIANLDAFCILELEDKTLDLSLELSLSDLFFRSKENRLIETQEGTIDMEKDAKLFLILDGPINDHRMKMISKNKFDAHRKNILLETQLAESELKAKLNSNRHSKKAQGPINPIRRKVL